MTMIIYRCEHMVLNNDRWVCPYRNKRTISADTNIIKDFGVICPKRKNIMDKVPICIEFA